MEETAAGGASAGPMRTTRRRAGPEAFDEAEPGPGDLAGYEYLLGYGLLPLGSPVSTG